MVGSEKHASLARSTLLNMSGFLVPIVVQLVTVPLYIKVIGVERYGVMALVWLLLGYFGFFDLGFGLAISSRIAGLSKSTSEARERVFWTGTCLSILTGLVGGGILSIVAEQLFGHILAVPHGLFAETKASLPLLMIALPVVTGISALSGALQGREAFGPMNLSQVTGSILYQIFPLIVGMVSPTLPGLVAGAIAGRLVTMAMLYVFCLRRVPARAFPRVTRSEVLPLLGFGGWVTLTGVISPMLTVFDRFVIGSITGMAAVTAYTLPYNLVMRMSSLTSAFQNALFPRFAMIEAVQANALLYDAIRIVSCLMAPVLIAGLVIMRPFLSIWIGPELADTAVPVGQILTLGLWANTMAFIPYGYLQSRGRPDLPAKFHVAELFVYAPALYFLTMRFGVVGAAWAWDLRVLVDALLLYGAVRRLPVLLAGWFGLLLVASAFFWVSDEDASSVVYWGGSILLLVVSLFWALRRLPPEMVQSLTKRLKLRGQVAQVTL